MRPRISQRPNRQHCYAALLALALTGTGLPAMAAPRGDDGDDGAPAGGEGGGGGCLGDVTNNNAVDVSDLLLVINSWGPCPAPPATCPADTNGDVIVNVIDLLNVINHWGTCPGCTGDSFEPDEDCGTLHTLPSIGSNQMLTVSTANLHNSGDVDVFRIFANETDSSCSCCDFWCADEDFRLTLTLTVPAGGPAYRMCLNTSCNFPDNYCIVVQPGTSGQQILTLDGSCPNVNSYTVYVKITTAESGTPVCAPYSLQYQFVPGCF